MISIISDKISNTKKNQLISEIELNFFIKQLENFIDEAKTTKIEMGTTKQISAGKKMRIKLILINN